MAAKKRRSSKKTVTVEIDVDTLLKLIAAAEALSEVAAAAVLHAKDPAVKKKLKGKRRKRS